MRQYIPVITLAMIGAFALAVVSGGLLPSDNAVQAQTAVPVFSENSPSRNVPENTPPGTNIGAPITATDGDDDEDDTLTYSLEEMGQNRTDSTSFDVDESTGQLITKSPLDEESQRSNTYLFYVKATDLDDNAGRVIVTITVTDVNEPPLAPAAPTVTSGTDAETLEVRWDAPDDTGREVTNSYEIQYKKVTDPDFETAEAADNSSDRTHSIDSLDADTAYHVRARAKNRDNTGSVAFDNEGPWSLVGMGITNSETNAAPEFQSTTATQNLLENTSAGQNIGDAIGATDIDSTRLVYSLEGEDADSFDIDHSTGQIMTKTGVSYNYEVKTSYTVLVKVDDGDGGSAVASVTIALGNVNEPPSQPDAPTVTAAEDVSSTDVDDSTTGIKVTWDAPANMGPPITSSDNDTGYEVQYREGTSGSFTDVNSSDIDVEKRSVTIVTDKAGASYQVRVQAKNGEGTSPWSRTGTGSTNAGNRSPEFTGSATRTFNVDENTSAGRNVGSAVRATDRDRDDLTYSLVRGSNETCDDDPLPDWCAFDINKSTGQILTKAALNYEAKNSYSLTVMADDDNGGDDEIAVTISVTNLSEPPSKPDKPTVKSVSTSTTSLEVSWPAAKNTGPDIDNYQLQYQGRGITRMMVTLSPPPSPLTYMIENLVADTEYQVQVRAVNQEGTGTWSDVGSGSTNNEDNDLPAFTDERDPVPLTVRENSDADENIGVAITADDADAHDVDYTLEGADRDSFTIGSSDGQIKTKRNVTYNYEAKSTYSVVVKAKDEEDGSSTKAVTITLIDEPGEHPDAPAAPTVTATADDEKTKNVDESTVSLDVSWNEPDNDGPDITSFSVEYRIKDSADDLQTISCAKTGDAESMKCFEDRETAITGLEDGTSYEVRVRAVNDEGTSPDDGPLGFGMTVEANNRAEFSSGRTATRSVAENTRSGQNVGAPVTANDRDADRLTYTLEGPGADSFTIDSRTGQIQTNSALDHESRQSYSVTVKADDGSETRNSFAAISVTIMVNDMDEPPSKPAAPTVMGISGSSDSVLVMWEEPANMGPAITDYDLQYREGSSGSFRSWPHDGMDMSAIVPGLRAGTSYQFQVLANNEEGPSQWSSSGSGRPDPDPANNLPVYTGGVRNFTVPENSAGGVNVGTPVTATDPDRDTLTYSLEGADSGSFEIVSVSGQIQTKADVDYNYEATKNSYSVTVKAEDTRGGSDTTAVRITVTDVDDEPPEAPAAPTVTATSDSDSSLDVSWVAPENPGPPITDYDYRYVEETAEIRSWNQVVDMTITGTTVTISELIPDTPYLVQVRATNADGTTEWSESGRGSTNPLQPNNPPEFDAPSTTRSVPENASAGTPIGEPVAATDADSGDTITYSLEGTDAASFGITPATGQITTRAALDAGTKDTYTVTVVASDGTDEDRITVTITVTSPPVFSEGTSTARSVPENASAGTPIGDPVAATDANSGDTITYSLEGTDAASFDITPATGQITTRAALDAATKSTYTVTVVASDGTDEDRITVTITVTSPPVFSEGTITARSVPENASAGTPIGEPVAATDADNDTLTYSLEGTDAASFDITPETGQITTRAALDAATKSTYTVTVVVSDGTDEARITVTITVTVINAPPVFSEGTITTRSVPENASAGTPIGEPVAATDADNDTLTYSLEGTDAASFDITPETGQITTRAALDAATKSTYTVTVVVSDGTDEARITVTITVTSVQDRCGDQGAVDPANIDLVSDCEALLDARDVLVGLGSPLNWSASTPIAQWDGVTVDGTPMRVTTLDLRKMRLKGMISSHLSRVTALRELYLQNNHLTGPMPSELGSMTALTHLYADNNDLSGAIPSQMGSMTELRQLRLRSNDLSGPLPAALGSLTNLTYLLLSDNDLSGSIPSQIGDMSSLYWLDVGQNNISGTLPAELGNLSQLGRLYVYENDLTGSIPSTLGNLTRLTHIVAQENDLSGSIPVQLGNMSALVWMGLYDNDLSGAIPTQLSRLSNLQRLYLSNNDLTGTIPRELGQLSALTNLWLDDNGLSGTIPSELDQLTNLVRWRMRGNDFTGCVPAGPGCGSEYRLSTSLVFPSAQVPDRAQVNPDGRSIISPAVGEVDRRTRAGRDRRYAAKSLAWGLTGCNGFLSSPRPPRTQFAFV